MATPKLVPFRGTTVIKGWPEILVREQRYHKKFKGVPRIKHSGSQCHDCCAIEGEYHVLGCDMEDCPKCGGQLLSCGCFK